MQFTVLHGFALALVLFVALQHVGFLVLEMFMVRKPLGQKIFRITPEQAEVLAPALANQGLYNGFLAAGLVWGASQAATQMGVQLMLFFLGCVVVAGIFGGLTTARAILFVQAVPGLAALVAVLVAFGCGGFPCGG